jgi:glycosyltransferase involved in cell wall biosynthesis
MKLAALVPFQFYGAKFGGADRVLNLLTRVDSQIDVYASSGGPDEIVEVKNLKIHYKQVPPEFFEHEDSDLANSRHAHQMFAKQLQDYDFVILEHPWQVHALTGQPFLYDAHNNEARMKEQLTNSAIAAETAQLERLALKANHVTYCSELDGIESDSPMTYVPNGTDLPDVKIGTGKQNRNLLFVGSAHTPNIAAAIMLASLAKAMPDYEIIIAGRCGDYINTDLPNVRLLGEVSNATLDFLFRNSHAFVNLMTAGSGTSLKVARALSYGLPVISSTLGARGYESGCIIANTTHELLSALEMLATGNHYGEASEASHNAAQGFSWDSIGARFNEAVISAAGSTSSAIE